MKWRVVVAVSSGHEFVVEADDEEEAKDAALDAAYEEYPFAEEYEIVWEPEHV